MASGDLLAWSYLGLLFFAFPALVETEVVLPSRHCDFLQILVDTQTIDRISPPHLNWWVVISSWPKPKEQPTEKICINSSYPETKKQQLLDIYKNPHPKLETFSPCKTVIRTVKHRYQWRQILHCPRIMQS